MYAQPYLNGLRPDVIIFSEDAGMGIFEVKDWNLNVYRIQGNKHRYSWQVRAQNTGEWQNRQCPLEQAEKYRQSIFK